MPVSLGPEGNLARFGVDQLSMLVVGLICQDGGDPLNVGSIQTA
jgi:hypothetical protein